ncbi:MAG: shikimate dehydrogenase [Verrucomicrobia bacterium]|nr:shikimate dehydrogenase [Verrucomicrobiota bacterium]
MSTQPFYTLDDLSRWEEIAPTLHLPARLAVIGDPIAHSRSPQMMNAALAARGIQAQYIRVQVPAGSVKEALRLFTLNGFVGVNCTIPHKFEALEAMDEVDPLAKKLGAVNTVRIRDGKLTGFNSDGPGFLRSVEEAFGKSVRDLRVLILGAGGGAGRAVAVQCALEQCPELTLVNRSPAKAEPLAAQCSGLSARTKVTVCRWDDAALRAVMDQTDLIVNATPLGMKEGDAPPFNLALLRASHRVFDMVYRSGAETPLISAAKTTGARTR